MMPYRRAVLLVAACCAPISCIGTLRAVDDRTWVSRGFRAAVAAPLLRELAFTDPSLQRPNFVISPRHGLA